MAINKTIQLTAQVLDGEILENALTIGVPCDKIKPIGLQTIRNYWKVTGCIVALDVFIVSINGRLFGCKDFDFDGFMSFYYASCKCCTEQQFCHLQINGCDATVNGCGLVFLN